MELVDPIDSLLEIKQEYDRIIALNTILCANDCKERRRVVMINSIAKSTVSIKSVFENRKLPLWVTFLFFLITTIGFTFPFVIGLASSDQISSRLLLGEEAEVILNSLDWTDIKSMNMTNGHLVGESKPVQIYQVGDKNFVLDYSDTISTENEIGFAGRITQDYMYFNIGFPLYSDYQTFENADFSMYSNIEIFDYFLKNGFRASIKQWFIPIYMLFYLVFLSINMFFIFGVTLLALLFRLGDRIKLSVFETLNIVVYSSAMPTVVSIIMSIFFGFLGMNLLIYNFGTLAIYMFVRKKYLNVKPIKNDHLIKT